MTLQELSRYLVAPDEVDGEVVPDLMELSEEYPYFAPLHVLILLALYRSGDTRFSLELYKRTPYIPDLRYFFTLLKEGSQQISAPAEEKEGTQIIADFLKSQHTKVPTLEELFDAVDPELPLFEEKPSALGDTDQLISSFLKNDTPTTDDHIAEHQEPEQEEVMTNAMARLCVRQGKFERAREILQQINLENPKNSSYFAEQISFLDKLIENGKQE